MGIKQRYNDNLRKLPNEYGDDSEIIISQKKKKKNVMKSYQIMHFILFSLLLNN